MNDIQNKIIYKTINKDEIYDIQDKKFELYKFILSEIIKDKYDQFVLYNSLSSKFDDVCKNVYKMASIAIDKYEENNNKQDN